MSKAKILIIDDDPMQLDVIMETFFGSGLSYEIFKTLSPAMALNIAVKEQPDLIITDWEMPGMSGIELINSLKENISTSDIPIIMCTEIMTSSNNLQTALNAGAADFIRKPVDPIDLIARTNSMLKLSDSIKKNKEQHSELKKSFIEIERMARTDPLTQVSNRRDLMGKIMHEKSRIDRKGGTFVVALGDIDKFKAFNDQYGHDCGDLVLVSVANQLQKMIRQQDSVGRWGGGEFLILFPDTDLEGGRVVVEKIRREIVENVCIFEDKSLKISITIGICEYDQSKDLDQCLKQVDEALHEGKQKGRNRVVAYQEEKGN